MTFLDGSCSGNRLPSERRVGRFRITPTWPPFGAGAATSTVWRYSRSRNAGCATRIIASSWPCAIAVAQVSSPRRATRRRAKVMRPVYFSFQRIATRPRAFVTSLAEGLDAGLRPPQDQGMDVVRALVRVHHLEVDQMADHAELVRDAVAAEHVAREARDLQRLAARVTLQDRGHLRRRRALVLHAP